jgi:hypothetical protein
MNYEIRTDHMFKLFNQSIARLRLTKTKRLILASLLVGTLVTLLPAPLLAAGRAPLNPGGQPVADTFSILLEGTYKPVGPHQGNLGLTTVDLDDGSYSKTKIYRITGHPAKDPIGTFFVQFNGNSAVYDLPGGAIAMVFTAFDTKTVPDGQGGTYIVGTIELDIPEATGRYKSFVGGHNTMVDILHLFADGRAFEHCICIISRKA